MQLRNFQDLHIYFCCLLFLLRVLVNYALFVLKAPAKHHAVPRHRHCSPMSYTQHVLAGLDGGDGSQLPPGSPPTGEPAHSVEFSLFTGHGQ